VAGRLKMHKKIKKAWCTNLNEERIEALKPEGKALAIAVGKKKIVTVEFEI